jgi:hypothetical protein
MSTENLLLDQLDAASQKISELSTKLAQSHKLYKMTLDNQVRALQDAETAKAQLAEAREELRIATLGICTCSGCERVTLNAWKDGDGQWCLECLSKQRNYARAAAEDFKNILSIRCIEHINTPQQNTSEITGAECGGCIAAERDKWKQLADLKDAKGEANRVENNNLRGENRRLQTELANAEKGRKEWCEECTKARDERDAARIHSNLLAKALTPFAGLSVETCSVCDGRANVARDPSDGCGNCGGIGQMVVGFPHPDDVELARNLVAEIKP